MTDVPALLADVSLLSGGTTLLCSLCQFNLAKSDFTSTQRKKREARRCKVCVDAAEGPSLQPTPSAPLASQSAAASGAPLHSSSTALLWRGLRADELPGLGLTPQAPTCTAGVRSALERGNEPNEYVHTTEDATTAVFFSAALNRQADPRIVLIDASKLSSRVIVLSSEEQCVSHGIAAGSRGCNFACSHRIVLVQGDVPPEAIVAVRAPPSDVPRGQSAGSLQSFRDALAPAVKVSIDEFNPRIHDDAITHISGFDGIPHMSDIVSLSFQHLWMYECAEISSVEQLRFTILQTHFYEYFPGRFGSMLFDELEHMVSTHTKSPGDALATTACEWHMGTVISKFWHDDEPREEHVGFKGRRMYGDGPTAWVAAFIAGCAHLEGKYTERQLVRCIRRACASATRALGLACSMSADSKEGWPAVKDHEGLY